MDWRRVHPRKFLSLARNSDRVPGTLHQLGIELNQRYYERRGPPNGVDVMTEDWDNLIILDGCRYDIFEELNSINGTLQQRTSKASESSEFITRNFVGRELHDTVYITTNPYSHLIPSGVFHAVISLLESTWDDESQTVLPEVVARAAREAHDDFPNKRLVVHFMQPHFPFIGETGQTIKQAGIQKSDNSKDTSDQMQIWKMLQYRVGNVDRDTVEKAYRENLELVLPVVDDLLSDLGGRSVVTSDHGNLVGEWIGPIQCRGYGHPPNLYVPGLISVPWLIVEQSPRRDIRSDQPIEREMEQAETIEARLEALGYR